MLARMPRRPRHAAVLAGLAGVLLLSGCGSTRPTPSPPSGVDGLTIPTPSPRPSDFTTRVDNPWFPLRPGTSSTYELTGTARTRVVSVTDRTETIAGVDTVVVGSRLLSGRGRTLSSTEAYYAQDRAGNVWLFGEQGGERTWRAGEGGAEAGLAMPASPRLGDGWREEHAPGVAEDVIRVYAIDQRREVPAGDYLDVLVLDTTSPLTPGTLVRNYFTRGRGLISSEEVPGGSEDLVATP